MLIDLKILSYHQFYDEDNDYAFSRTYKQFRDDLSRFDFDWITIDDGHHSIIKACKMLRDSNIRAKLFISTALIGQPGYCTWKDIWHLSRFHDIENHSHNHVHLIDETYPDGVVLYNVSEASKLIREHVGKSPRYFVPPWNEYSERIQKAADMLKLTIVKDRINIKNDT